MDFMTLNPCIRTFFPVVTSEAEEAETLSGVANGDMALPLAVSTEGTSLARFHCMTFTHSHWDGFDPG